MAASYPMYGMKVRDLLAMEEWLPHQDLLAAGKLHVISEDEMNRNRVIFLSHQWCSFLHPDPKADQLKALPDRRNTILKCRAKRTFGSCRRARRLSAGRARPAVPPERP